jgi:hypothetical protein
MLANGDAIASLVKEPGDASAPYARIDRLTRMLNLLPGNQSQDERRTG